MEINRITKEELTGKIDNREGIVIIDVRAPLSYAASSVKIKGALRIPLDDIEKRYKELDPEKEVVSYCT